MVVATRPRHGDESKLTGVIFDRFIVGDHRSGAFFFSFDVSDLFPPPYPLPPFFRRFSTQKIEFHMLMSFDYISLR